MRKIQVLLSNSDFKFFVTSVFVLVVIGLIMVYSSSYIYSKELYGVPSYLFFKQLGFLCAGMALAVLIACTKLSFWIKYGEYVHVGAVTLLLLTFFPGIGSNVKGASRWISLGFSTIQPSEFVKISSIFIVIRIFTENWASREKELIKQCALLATPLLLLIMQPDFGSFSILVLIALFVAYLSKFSRKIFYSVTVGSGLIMLAVLFSSPYRIKRVMAFLDPWKTAKTSGFQVVQSFLAFANGGFTGSGLGNSNEKLFYLPEAHNDFILSVVGEELGFIGIAFIIFLFMSLTYFGLRIAFRHHKEFGTLLVAAAVFLISMQAFLNMGVVMGLLPTKGLNLPFISYGGSSMLANFILVGLIASAKMADIEREQI